MNMFSPPKNQDDVSKQDPCMAPEDRHKESQSIQSEQLKAYLAQIPSEDTVNSRLYSRMACDAGATGGSRKKEGEQDVAVLFQHPEEAWATC